MVIQFLALVYLETEYLTNTPFTTKEHSKIGNDNLFYLSELSFKNKKKVNSFNSSSGETKKAKEESKESSG